MTDNEISILTLVKTDNVTKITELLGKIPIEILKYNTETLPHIV